MALKSAEGPCSRPISKCGSPSANGWSMSSSPPNEDLGYETYIFEKQHAIAKNIDLARKFNGEKKRRRMPRASHRRAGFTTLWKR